MQEVSENVIVATHFRGPSVAAVLTDEGYVLIDAPPFPDDARRWHDMLMRKQETGMRAMILMDSHPERLLGAYNMKPDVLISHEATYEHIRTLPNSYASTVAGLLTRSHYEQNELASCKIMLPIIIFGKALRLNFGEVELHLEHRPGPTNGSIWVKYLDQRILFAGDNVVVGTVPYLNSLHSIPWMEALKELREDEFPADIIVAGHGNITVKNAIDPMLQYLETARSRVSQMFENGQSLTETNRLVNDLLNFFPPPLESELASVQQRVRTGLQSIYNEIRE